MKEIFPMIVLFFFAACYCGLMNWLNGERWILFNRIRDTVGLIRKLIFDKKGKTE